MIKQNFSQDNSFSDIENTIDSILKSGSAEINVDELIKKFPDNGDSDGAALLRNRIVRELENNQSLITSIPGNRYLSAEKLFKNRGFLIVPDAFEIENNILVPGHRFVPFMSPDLFPSEVTFKESGSRKRQSFREITGSAEDLIKYHLLMGAETLFDFFAAEADENMVNARESANPVLKLTAIDMEKFYRETSFTEGDVLLVKVVDYTTGSFEFHLSNGQERVTRKMQQYRSDFENALVRITEDLLPGAPIIEQLQCMFANNPELMQSPAMSLDEILMNDSTFDIAFDEDGSSLIKRDEENSGESCCCSHEHDHNHDESCHCHHSHHHDLPENITIGSGETGSLESMLEKLYPMLNLVELDAILLDNFKNHDFDFNSFYARAFGESALPFADGMQEACFFNELESRFEEMLDHYPRELDSAAGEIRNMIVEFTMERCALLTELSELAEELTIKPELFEALAD